MIINNFFEHQIAYLLILQNFREFSNGIFDKFFISITELGEITIPLIIVSWIYWCNNTKYGMFILWNWGLGFIVNEFLKNTACIYRPWILDNRIHPVPQALNMSGGYSFPSGHTQNAVSIFGGIAVSFHKKFLTILMIFLILLIAFSRNYLGVHTPQDVVVSLITGCFILYFLKKIEKWAEYTKNADIIILSVVYLFSLFLVLFEHFKSYPMDYVNGQLLVNPDLMRLYTFPKIGIILGIFTGWVLNNRFLKFDGSIGNSNEKLLRFLFGTIILSIIFTKGTDFFMLLMAKKYAMFFSAFLSMLFLTFLYPLCINYIELNKKSLQKESVKQ